MTSDFILRKERKWNLIFPGQILEKERNLVDLKHMVKWLAQKPLAADYLGENLSEWPRLMLAFMWLNWSMKNALSFLFVNDHCY